MGRPLIDPALKKNYSHNAYFYKEEYYDLAKHIIRRGMHISEFMRQAALEKMDREKKETTA